MGGPTRALRPGPGTHLTAGLVCRGVSVIDAVPQRVRTGAVAVLVAALPVPAMAPAVGGGVAAALLGGSRRVDTRLGAVVGVLGGLGYIAGWTVLAFVLQGAFPPELPDGNGFVGFAVYVLLLDLLGGAVGGLVGGALARRARDRGEDEGPSGLERPE